MKDLTGIKLINWHYFTNETIRIKNSVLLTGDNGSGKSTILDAMQYVLVADLRKIKFNVSAHDETKRDLLGYLRCKTGNDRSDGRKFLRQGDITSFVVLEFFDTDKQKPFLLGVVADSYADDINWDSRFFKIENQALADELFFLPGTRRPRNIKAFRDHLKKLPAATLYPSADQYRRDLLQKLGSLNERFFELLVKAISFKPITDIREFVYNYVLDAKPIQIEAMVENFRRYSEYRNLARQTREKIEDLTAILDRYQEIRNQQETARMQEYIIKGATAVGLRAELEANLRDSARKEEDLNRIKSELAGLANREEVLEGECNGYREALAASSTYQLIKDLEREISWLEVEEKRLEQDRQMLKELAAAELASLRRLLAANCLTESEKLTLAPLLPLLTALSQGQGGEGAAAALAAGLAALKEVQARLDREIWTLKGRLQELTEREEKLRSELAQLRQGRFAYDRRITDLQAVIRQGFRQDKGLEVEVAVLCELLEIRDEKWRDAVEGFLNTQRFDLMVEPQHFDYALTLYERYKRQKGISGVGLVNTRAVEKFVNRIEPNALAEEVLTDNIYARGYINQLLGNVIKCETEQELKYHRRAITPTCMTYQNNTARQINFKVYETPYIGEKAIPKQIAKKEGELAELVREREQLAAMLAERESWRRETADKEGSYAKLTDRLPAITRLAAIRDELAAKRAELDRVDRSDLEALQGQLALRQAELKQVREQINLRNREAGAAEEALKRARNLQLELKLQAEAAEAEWEEFKRRYPELAVRGEERLQKELARKKPREVAESFRINYQGLLTQINTKQQQLMSLQSQYNNRWHFGGRIDGNDIAEYRAEYQKLADSELPEYEEKILQAQKEAEEEFKEHFIYKLKENIELAQSQFNTLNDALKDIAFGSDKYRFLVTPSQKYKRFYDMIMDTDLLGGGESLFASHFRERHREAMDELFERMENQHLEAVKENVELFTDYRTFLDYDIKIYHANGEVSTFSKVCREKSGGETQTPYYVAIVASFLQLYRLKHNRAAARLVMFDEAFNRMDSDRVENFLRFLRDLGLQALIAAPTDKCEYIAPYVGTTLLVMRDGHSSWIEDYKVLKEEMLRR